MDIKQLHAFITLAETKNYGRASEKLFVTQPALTKQIQALEKELGVTLFVRGRSGATLTPIAEMLLPKTLALVCQIHEYRSFVTSATKMLNNKMTVGFGISFIKKVPKWITEFKHSYPDVEINLQDKPSSTQIHELLTGTLQLAFMRMPVSPPLKSHFITADSLCLAANKHSEWMGEFKKNNDYGFISDMPILKISPDRGPGLDRQITSFLNSNGLTLTKLQQYDDIQTLMALASEDAGVAIVPRTSEWFSNENIEFTPVHGPFSRWDTGMVWNPLFAHSARDLFIKMVKSYCT